MSVKNVSLFALALILLGAGAARAQDPGASPYPTPSPATSLAGPSSPAAPPAEPGQGLAPSSPSPPRALSTFILYNQPCCCGPLGHHWPMRYELYVRGGPSIPVGDGPLGQALETGWAIQGGTRLLFFNTPQTRAWTVDLSLSNIHNNGDMPDLRVPIILNDDVPNPNFNPLLPPGPGNEQVLSLREPIRMAIRSLNRTMVNLGLGGEVYLIGDGSGRGPSWRTGLDAGGSWGTAKVDWIGPARHRTDVIGRAFIGVHSDLEIPIGCCIFYGGVRAEYDYTWSDILQSQNNGDVQDLNLLATVGVRF